MARFTRAALVFLFAAAVPSTAAATGPELGGRLSPVPLVFEDDQHVSITSLATIEVDVALTVEGDGWQLVPSALTLAPGEQQEVAITAAGADEATLRVRFTPADQLAGDDTSALVMEARLRHRGPWEALPWPIIALVAMLAALGVLWALRRRTAAGGIR